MLLGGGLGSWWHINPELLKGVRSGATGGGQSCAVSSISADRGARVSSWCTILSELPNGARFLVPSLTAALRRCGRKA